MKHNHAIQKCHFHKKWQTRVKTWLEQPMRAKRRRNLPCIRFLTSAFYRICCALSLEKICAESALGGRLESSHQGGQDRAPPGFGCSPSGRSLPDGEIQPQGGLKYVMLCLVAASKLGFMSYPVAVHVLDFFSSLVLYARQCLCNEQNHMLVDRFVSAVASRWTSSRLPVSVPSRPSRSASPWTIAARTAVRSLCRRTSSG